MGNFFTLDAATLGVIAGALDDVLDNFSKTCLLVYPPRFSRCPNCLWDASTGRSTNRWRGGGPVPFNGGACPMCKGDGQAAQDQTEQVQLKVEWDPKRFVFPFPGLELRVKHSVCETKMFPQLVPKVQQCDHMVLQLPVVGIVDTKMKLASDPVSPGNIVQNRYWVCYWSSLG